MQREICREAAPSNNSFKFARKMRGLGPRYSLDPLIRTLAPGEWRVFETFIQIINRAIELAREREKSKRKYFEDFIDPLYLEFEKAAKTYFSLYQDALRDLRSARTKSRIFNCISAAP